MLEINQLTFGYQSLKIFDRLTFSVQPGQILHINGPNGAGKSTLIRILAGLHTPSAGKIALRASSTAAVAASINVLEDRQWTTQFAYVASEGNGLFSTVSALENLKFWLKLRNITISHEQLEDELRFWGFQKAFFRDYLPVSMFSTGMKRRIALARLCLSQSKVWLLDEPLFGLDQKSIGLFQLRMRKHLEHNGYILIVSHDLSILQGFDSKSLELGNAHI